MQNTLFKKNLENLKWEIVLGRRTGFIPKAKTEEELTLHPGDPRRLELKPGTFKSAFRRAFFGTCNFQIFYHVVT